MAKVMKDIYLTWSWDGDDELLEGFNLSITPADSNPNNDSVIQQTTNARKTDILNQGTAKFEHILRNVMLDESKEYISWVQALTEGDDSEWISTNNLVVSDDGTATIATESSVDNVVASLGDLASEDMVEEAKLGSTIIDGGYIKSNLLTANNIITGILDADVANIHANNGNITIDGNGIKSEDADGNYSLLDSDQLAFYEAGDSTPHWYTKNVAYGTNDSGDKITVDFDGDKPLKVITSISDLYSYIEGSSNSDQRYRTFINKLSNTEFYVYGENYIDGGTSSITYNYTYHVDNQQWYYTDYSEANTTEITITVTSGAGGFSFMELNVYYRQKSTNNRYFYGTLAANYDGQNFSVTIPNLSGDEYRFELKLTAQEVIVRTFSWTTSGYTLDSGKVSWIAVEGGVE